MKGQEHATLVPALGRVQVFRRQLSHKKPVIFLDYDGTLAPIVSKPYLAVVSPEMKAAVDWLARFCTVAIITGRSRETVKRFLGLDNVIYAGSHGLDIAGPRGSGLRCDVGRDFYQTIRRLSGDLAQALQGIRGALVEQNRYNTAVHYRLVAPEEVGHLRKLVDNVLLNHSNLRKTEGKMILEIRPAIDWDKGKAALWILETLGLDSSHALPFYIGDDVTDEDAFRALKERGIGILVAEAPRKTAATYILRDTEEVYRFLQAMIQLLKALPASSSGR